MRNFKPKICENCNGEYTPRSSRDKWCENCRTFTCEYCKKVFVVRRVQAAKNTKYCSKECLVKGRNPRINHICPKCKKPFTSKSGNSALCPSCCTLQCEVCGKKYKVQPKYLMSSKYCSKECRSKGDMNYIWKSEDLEYIQNNYPFTVSMKELAKKYNTSISAVGRIITKLNLPKCPIDLRQKRVGDTQRVWTKDKITKKNTRPNKKRQRNKLSHFSKKIWQHTLCCL